MSRHIIRIICVATLLAFPLLFVEARWMTQPVGAQARKMTTERQPRRINRRSNVPTVLATYHAQNAAPQVKTAEQRYKNIQVFKGVPASEVQSMMTFIASSLGVGCNYCHVGGGAFEKDDKPTKLAARRMVQMMRNINDTNFGGKTVVSCNTCHRGSTRPVPVPALTLNAAPRAEAGAPVTTDASLPSAEQVIDKYIEAIGGKTALASVKTRLVKGSRVNADGSVVPTEIYQKAPDKILTVVNYPNLSFFAAFNGTDGWARDSHGAGEITKELLILTKRDSEFFFGTRFSQLYTDMSLAGKQKVGEQEAYVVNANSSEGGTESLFFDTKTGLLLQRRIEVRTPLGSYPFQIKYEDYRVVDGIKLPFALQWSRPGLQWSRKITEVIHNVPIEDSKFNPPPAQN